MGHKRGRLRWVIFKAGNSIIILHIAFSFSSIILNQIGLPLIRVNQIIYSQSKKWHRYRIVISCYEITM